MSDIEKVFLESFSVLKAVNIKSTVRDFRLRGGVHDICSLLGCYATQNGSLLRTFRENLSVPSSRDKPSRGKAINRFINP